jgi:hypothetical protein
MFKKIIKNNQAQSSLHKKANRDRKLLKSSRSHSRGQLEKLKGSGVSQNQTG